jgi:MFS family permease
MVRDGRAGDILGRRRIFVAELAVFTVASLAVGLAPDPGWLIGASMRRDRTRPDLVGR